MNSNPALFATPRHQVNVGIAPRINVSIFDWLEADGRFIQGDDYETSWSVEEEELLMDSALTVADDLDD